MVSNFIVSERKKTGKHLRYFKTFAEIYKKGGLSAFYNGYLYSLFLVINPTINMQVFELAKVFLPAILPKDAALFSAGALSKLAATLATYPMQTLKTTMQAATDSKSSAEHLFFILKEFGPLGLFKGKTSLILGIAAKLSHTVLNSALQLFVTEKINEAVVKAVVGK